jgi:hypothetical protein
MPYTNVNFIAADCKRALDVSLREEAQCLHLAQAALPHQLLQAAVGALGLSARAGSAEGGGDGG